MPTAASTPPTTDWTPCHSRLDAARHLDAVPPPLPVSWTPTAASMTPTTNWMPRHCRLDAAYRLDAAPPPLGRRCRVLHRLCILGAWSASLSPGRHPRALPLLSSTKRSCCCHRFFFCQ
ncbi:hypothetical protein E2562_016731 [Oryza meyeriana var. granulata]|uniref:Uncharacterized protein n=1 Tax=Oryza meyeriana var. granulata TaxID=110450 RepID=A0A6G1BXR0_9ORYZ|nr:hypothetical protein E2562_016731 [Oryza meyeriana var. granulata]